MELTDEQKIKLKKIITKKMTVKEVLLEVCDEKYKKYLEYYLKGNSVSSIAKEFDISVEKSEEILKYLIELNTKIMQIKKEYNTKRKQKIYNKYIRGEKVLNKDEKKLVEKNFKMFKGKFKAGKLSQANISKNLKKLEVMVKLLGNNYEDRLFLAEIYLKLQDFQNSFKIVYELESDNELTKTQTGKVEEMKKSIIKGRNTEFIKNLYKEGKSLAQIIEIAENENSEYRKYIDIKFIKDTIQEYKLNLKEQKEKNKKVRKNSNSKTDINR